MGRRRVVLASLVVLTAGSLWLGQRQVARRLLERAAVAQQQLDYHGTQQTRSWLADRPPVRVAVNHQATRGTRREYLNGAEAGRVVVTPPAPGLRTAVLADYRLLWLPGRPVAGRATWQVHLLGHGLRRTVWLDRETGLVLRTRTRLANGLTTDTAFIDFTPGQAGTPIEPPPAPTSGDEAPWMATAPGWLPAGYALVSRQPRRCPCGCGAASLHLVYTDGVGSLSVFIHDPDCPHCFAPAAACDACAATGACLAAADSALNAVARVDRRPAVMVVGDRSRADLARIANSVPGS